MSKYGGNGQTAKPCTGINHQLRTNKTKKRQKKIKNIKRQKKLFLCVFELNLIPSVN